MSKSKSTFLTAVGLCALQLGTAALAAGDPALVRVDTGVLRGTVQGEVRSFKGVPFAAPPVGNLRWKAPQRPAVWDGIRAATEYGAWCMQPETHRALPAPTPVLPPVPNMSEDCLTLNVWAPTSTKGPKRPVMVWIHGGGFYMGSGAWPDWDGSHLVKNGVIVVTVNYRLGAFGLFAHPALSAETNTEPVTNFALLDVVESLMWVKRNIAAFGGDPGNVTIFGESGGGVLVNLLMVSPLSEGLFHRAIAQSAPIGFVDRHLAQSTDRAPSAESWGQEWAKKVGVAQDLKSLRALSADNVLANSMGMGKNTGFVIDGTSLTMSIMDAFRAGKQHKVPYMAGAADDEGGLLAFMGPTWPMLEQRLGDKRDAVLKAYDPNGNLSKDLVRQMIVGDTLMIRPSQYLSRQAAQSGPSGYSYVFAYVPESVRSMVHGAWHGAEIAYIFGTLDSRHPAHGSATAPDIDVSQRMRAYWTNFARTGKPDSAGGPEWLGADRGTMVFGIDGVKFSSDYLKARMEAIGPQDNPVIP